MNLDRKNTVCSYVYFLTPRNPDLRKNDVIYSYGKSNAEKTHWNKHKIAKLVTKGMIA